MATTDEDLVRAESIVKALPFMSKTIVDDTLYEKVLSFLTLVINKDPANAAIFESWGILDIVHQTLEKGDQDYRLYTVCFRLLGALVVCDDSVFNKLHDQPAVLARITAGLRAPEAAIRCASIEAVRGFTTCETGTLWVLESETAKILLPLALVDESIYVIGEACKLYRALIEQSESKIPGYRECIIQLCDVMDPSTQIQQFLVPNTNESLILASLEFCWTMIHSGTKATLEYIREKRVLRNLFQLLDDRNRIIRSRVIDVLGAVFDQAPHFLDLIDSHTPSTDYQPEHTYELVTKKCKELILDARYVDDVATGISLMHRTLPLLANHDFCGKNSSIKEAKQFAIDILSICLEKNASNTVDIFAKLRERLCEASRSHFTKRHISHLVLKWMHSLATSFPHLVVDIPTLHLILSILSVPFLAQDQRVFKASLNLILLMLHTLAEGQDEEGDMPSLLIEPIKILTKMLGDSELDCLSVTLLLDTFDMVLASLNLNTVLLDTSTSANFIEALTLKLMDREWDVRDAAVEFSCKLFAEPLTDTKLRFAIIHHLPINVLARIQDSESYVRASALKAYQNIIKSQPAWARYQDDDMDLPNIAAQFPMLLQDTEALVRRATLDTFTCLLENEVPFLFDSTNDAELLNEKIMSRLMDDPDSEVRIRACRLLEALFLCHTQLSYRDKRARSLVVEVEGVQDALPMFYAIQGDQWIIEATKDSHRLVRAEALRVIETLLQKSRVKGDQGSKRPWEDASDRDAMFLHALSCINLDQLRATVNPEHLYQEAFDINAAMMTYSLEPSHPGDDVNLPDCY